MMLGYFLSAFPLKIYTQVLDKITTQLNSLVEGDSHEVTVAVLKVYHKLIATLKPEFRDTCKNMDLIELSF